MSSNVTIQPSTAEVALVPAKPALATKLQDLPIDWLISILPYLSPKDIFALEVLYANWIRLTPEHQQKLWRAFCKGVGLTVDPISSQPPASVPNTAAAASNEAGSAQTDYRMLWDQSVGIVRLKENSPAVHLPFDNAANRLSTWAVAFTVQNGTGKQACMQQHGVCAHKRLPHLDWHHAHPTVDRFPKRIPVCVFMNENYGYKKDGDTIKIERYGHRFVLICTSTKGVPFNEMLRNKMAALSPSELGKQKAWVKNSPEWRPCMELRLITEDHQRRIGELVIVAPYLAWI